MHHLQRSALRESEARRLLLLLMLLLLPHLRRRRSALPNPGQGETDRALPKRVGWREASSPARKKEMLRSGGLIVMGVLVLRGPTLPAAAPFTCGAAMKTTRAVATAAAGGLRPPLLLLVPLPWRLPALQEEEEEFMEGWLEEVEG